MSEKYDNKYKTCPICGSSAIYDFHKDFRENHISRCKDCGVQFMNPVYSDEYLAEYYAGYITPEYTKKTLDEQHEVCKQNFTAIGRFKPDQGEMLDFGLGNGTYAQYARELGWQVSGYDVDCETTRGLAAKLGMDIHCGDFDKLDWGGKKFDLIYAHHVVEHLKDPLARLKRFHEILKPDGCLYIGVPNISAWGSKIKLLLEKLGLKKNRIGNYYDSEHHIVYYSPASLRNLLQLAGFKVVYKSNASKPKPYQNPLIKFLRQNVKEKIYAALEFFVNAKKINNDSE